MVWLFCDALTVDLFCCRSVSGLGAAACFCCVLGCVGSGVLLFCLAYFTIRV